MNQYNFELAGGFPFELDILKEMQDNYTSFQAFGDLAGNFSIISGCIKNGNNISAGVVYYNGELLPFSSGTEQSKVVIKETLVRKLFENGTQPVVLKQRVMCFGTGTTAINWSNFKRPKTTLQLTEDQAKKEDKTVVAQLLDRIVALENRPDTGIPIGLVAIWGLPLQDIPNGWVEHVPLIGRTPIGYDQSYTQGDDSIDYKLNEKGASIGAREIGLSVDQLPAHSHTGKTDDDGLHNHPHRGSHTGDNNALWHPNNETAIATGFDNPRSRIGAIDNSGIHNHEFTTNNTGSNEKHPNIQPSRVVEFIRYVGLQNN